MRLLRVAGALLVGLFAAAVAVMVLPPMLIQDASAPRSLTPYIAEARHRAWTEATDGLRLPLHLRFVEARCSTDGRGAVALIFEEWRPPYLDITHSVVWRGSMPTPENDSWGGGSDIRSFETDPEFIHVMGPDSSPCE
ncbi:MAG: hypothetical protein M3395_00260 [Chloroflexota bacterium]|nr:hypothetical protein [Chloroflexota bacterium]